MVLSPFTFYRGSAFAMAQDLAGTPSTGIRVQCGGDSHLVNFRGLATAERQVIFALNDLDETLPAPWEWDLKRLAASVTVCSNGQTAAAVNPHTGNAAVAQKNSNGVTTTQTSNGGRA